MTHSEELAAGERFSFGANWSNFINTLNEERVQEAEKSLREFLDVFSLDGKSFLDVGSGSGLFSLAARRLGARVQSFDYDPQSVACTTQLKKRYFPDDPAWVVEEGSVLDVDYLSRLGQFDVVYSWGVLHHTGQMWNALENIMPLVRGGGVVNIAIYNSSPYSRRWRMIKRMYCRMPPILKPLFAVSIIVPIQLNKIVNAAIRFKLGGYVSEIRHYTENRGMNWWHDRVDWLGGYPYETASPEEIFYLFKDKGFRMEKMSTCGGGTGCNQFVFVKES